MSEMLHKLPFEQLARMVQNLDRFDPDFKKPDVLNEDKTEEKLVEVSDRIIEEGV